MTQLRPHPFLVGFPFIPPGGVRQTGTVLGHPDTLGTSRSLTDGFIPVFESLYGVTLVAGSLSLRINTPWEWEDPTVLDIGGRHWEFCPVVLEEREVGVAFRANQEPGELLEVVATTHLRTALGGLLDGAPISLRLLPGWDLRPPA